jgi:Phosphotransferase enzyme family
VLPQVLAGLGAEASSAWSLQQVVRSATDRTVALVGPAGGPARVAVKLAGSAGAAAALAREVDSRRRLCADLRLEEWRSLLPELIHVGRAGGVSYLVERAVPGKEATRLLESGADPARVLRSSMEAFGALHRLTATEVVVDEAVVGAWVDEPLAVLEHYLAGTPRRAWLNIALEGVRGSLHEALFGRRLTASSLHGDCVPGNVFLDLGGGRVNGIVDWELATDRDLPALDVLQLILSTRALMRRRELGEIVLGALEAPWTDDERELLAHAATDGLSDRTLVTLTWLRHTAGMLTKAPAYADNWLWTRANLEAVLVELA